MKLSEAFGKDSVEIIPRTGISTELSKKTDDAMKQGKTLILIQNWSFGRDLAMWLNLGHHLVDLSLYLAAGSIISALGPHESCRMLCKPLAIASLAANVSYYGGWLLQPWSRYRVAYGPDLSIYRCLKRQDEEKKEEEVLLVRHPDMYCPWVSSLAALGSLVFAFRNQFHFNSEDIKDFFSGLKDRFSNTAEGEEKSE